MFTADVIVSSILYAIGLYGALVGLLGLFNPRLAARLGAELAGTAPYLSMAVLGLFGFIGGAALLTISFGQAPYTGEAIVLVAVVAVFSGIFWLTGIAPAMLYVVLSKVRFRIDPGNRRRRRFGDRISWLIPKRRKETHDEKIQNTIATAGILGVAVAVINAVLAAKLFDLEYSSAGEVFAVVCAILVFTTVFAAGALQRFDAWE